VQVDGDNREPVLGAELVERGRIRFPDAGVVEQDVNASEVPVREGKGLPYRSLVSDVAADGKRPSAPKRLG